MATLEDAQAGWQILRESEFALSLDEVNQMLTRSGFAPVSPRMWRHYQKLRRLGYSRYVPINRLDVGTWTDPFADGMGRSLDRLVDVSSPVVVRLLDGIRIIELRGHTIEASPVQAVVRLAGPTAATVFPRLDRLARQVEVEFVRTGQIVSGTVERLALNVDSETITVRISFFRPVGNRELTGAAPASDSAVVVVRFDTSSPPSVEEAALRLFWLSQASSAAASAGSLFESAYSSLPSAIEAPRLLSLRTGSIEAELLLTAKAAGLLFAGLRAWISLKKNYWESEKAKAEVMRLRWENQRDGIEVSTSRLSATVAQILGRNREDDTSRVEPQEVPAALPTALGQLVAASGRLAGEEGGLSNAEFSAGTSERVLYEGEALQSALEDELNRSRSTE